MVLKKNSNNDFIYKNKKNEKHVRNRLKPNSTSQNGLVRWCIFMSYVRQEISGWFIRSPISGRTKCQREFVSIGSNLALIPC